MGVSALALLCACGTEASTTDPADEAPPPFADITALFDRAIAPTCSLNNGVCHNSNNYPDLHTIERLVDTIDQPCNVEVTEAVQMHDACEPAADRLVLPGIDARIVHAKLLPAEQSDPTKALTQITLILDSAPAGLAPGATNAAIARDTTSFEVGEYGARVATVNGTEVVLDLSSSPGARAFFDIRVFPPGPLRLHVGDPNGNGVEGARATPMPLVASGEPMRSYLLHRLIDPTFGELMPRQCRTWSDGANRALACWIAGLDHTDPYAPIDYASCAVEVKGMGKCN